MSSEFWRTPPEILREVALKYHIVHDVCASEGSQVCVSFWFDDALKRDWAAKFNERAEPFCNTEKRPVLWMNPPWRSGNKRKGITPISIKPWLVKAATCGAPVLALLPIDTSTQNFHEFIYPCLMRGDGEFLSRRVKYLDGITGQPIGSAKFASALVLFDSEKQGDDRTEEEMEKNQ